MLDGKIVILQVIGGLSMGGAESRIMDILRRLDRKRFHYDFLLNEPPGFYEEEAERLGCRIFRTVGFKLINRLQYEKQMRDFFAAHPEIDIVQAHSTNTAALYLPIAKKAGIAVTMAHARSAGVEPGMKGWLKKRLRRHLAKKTDYCLSCSTEAGYAVFGEEAMKAGRVRLIPNAVNVDAYAPTTSHVAEGRSLREKTGLGKQFVVGHVGRFHYAKNHIFLLKIFLELRRIRDDATLLLVGEGELREQVEKAAEEMGLRRNVIFAGRQADPAPWYQAMDILVFPSHYEGLPGTVVEAQASALPCLISDAITKDVQVTELVKALSLKESEKSWAVQALALTERFPRNERSAKLQYADQLREKGFDVNRQVRMLEEMYTEVLARK